MFSRATITLGIGPHSSFHCFYFISSADLRVTMRVANAITSLSLSPVNQMPAGDTAINIY